VSERGNILDPCNFDLQSERTRTYDVTEIRTLTLWTGAATDAEQIKCNDCNPNQAYPDEAAADCTWRGDCNKNTKSCDCDDNHFGQRCEFQGPCTEMVMQNAFHGFDGGRSFDLVSFDERPVMVHDRPVYSQELEDGNLVLIVFDGGRWQVILEGEFLDWKDDFSHDGAITKDDGEKKSFFEYLENDFNPINSTYAAYKDDGEKKSFFEYLENEFNPINSAYAAYYVSEYSSLGSPMGVSFRAWLTSGEGGDSSLGRLGDEEFDLLCADCTSYYNYTRPGGVSCQNRWGQDDNSMCMPTKSTLHGIVNRCNCTIGFDGPTCNIRPVEGTVSVHLDHATGVCSVCGEGNTWVTYESAISGLSRG